MRSKRLYVFQARIILFHFFLCSFIVVYSPDGTVTAFIPLGINLFCCCCRILKLQCAQYFQTFSDGLCDSGHTALTRVSRHVLIKKYLICLHIIPLICMIYVFTLSNKCFWILNLESRQTDIMVHSKRLTDTMVVSLVGIVRVTIYSYYMVLYKDNYLLVSRS